MAIIKTVKKVTLLGSLLMFSGCASIVSDSSYPVAIQSTPDFANFTITNKSGVTVHTGVTPTIVTLKAGAGYFKSESYSIKVSKEGYADKTFVLSSTMDGWYWGNILIGGLIGMLIVDPITGAMYKLPADVAINLDTTTTASNNQIMTIASYDSLNEEQKAKLIKVN
ncbi:MAG: hypothetical protein K0Q67_1515 [Cellvibrio sp.]|jgi:hypothetical protein|nr:hypothetical protein [Cellvibrio sp.]